MRGPSSLGGLSASPSVKRKPGCGLSPDLPATGLPDPPAPSAGLFVDSRHPAPPMRLHKAPGQIAAPQGERTSGLTRAIAAPSRALGPPRSLSIPRGSNYARPSRNGGCYLPPPPVVELVVQDPEIRPLVPRQRPPCRQRNFQSVYILPLYAPPDRPTVAAARRGNERGRQRRQLLL